MGQYYKVFMRRGEEDKVYSVNVLNEEKGEYWNGMKLMEHSWWENPLSEAVVLSILDKPTHIAWVGDYAEDDECKERGLDYNDVWGETSLKSKRLLHIDFSLDNVKYLVNNTKKVYVDMKKYYEKSSVIWKGSEQKMCIFPISLLTAIGNDRGGGDFHKGIGYDDIGTWAMDEIYVTNKNPPDGYTEKELCFIEQ